MLGTELLLGKLHGALGQGDGLGIFSRLIELARLPKERGQVVGFGPSLSTARGCEHHEQCYAAPKPCAPPLDHHGRLRVRDGVRESDPNTSWPPPRRGL